MKRLRNFIPDPSRWLGTLLTPAADPRRAFADVVERQQELLARVRRAQASINGSRRRIEAKLEEGRSKLRALREQARRAGRDDVTRFAAGLHRLAAQEFHALEEELRSLQQEEAVLPLVEQRLVAEVDALRARQAVLEARHRTEEAHVSVREALGGIADEVASLGAALEHAEQRSERLQARASAIGQLVDLGIPQGPGGTTGDASARRLALRFSFEAGNEELAEFKEQLDRGLEAVQHLLYEFEQLKPLLRRRRATDPLAVAHVPALAEETYRQGMSALEDALELMRAIHSPGRRQLEAEIAALEQELAAPQLDGAQSERARTVQETLASLERQLEALERQRLRVDELIRHAGRCQAALQQSRIEVAGISASGSEINASAVIETLLKTLQQARAVQEEMTRPGIE